MCQMTNEASSKATCYALATMVSEEGGKDKLTFHAVGYFDKYVKIESQCWIAERMQFRVEHIPTDGVKGISRQQRFWWAKKKKRCIFSHL